MSPALSDLPVRGVARALRTAGFEQVRVKVATPSTATLTGG
jgi:hypothetical protein